MIVQTRFITFIDNKSLHNGGPQMEQQNSDEKLNGADIQQIAFDFFTALCESDKVFATYFTPTFDKYQNWKFVRLAREGSWDYTFCYASLKNFVKLNFNMGHFYNPQKLKEIEPFYTFDPGSHHDNKKINFVGDSFQHNGGHVDCEGLSREDLLRWLSEASQQMLEFRIKKHNDLISLR